MVLTHEDKPYNIRLMLSLRKAILFFIFIFVFAPVLSAQVIYLSPESPASRLLDELQVRGYFSNLPQSERPVLYSDILNGIAVDSVKYSDSDRLIAKRLLDNLNVTSAIQGYSAGFNADISLFGQVNGEDDGYLVYRNRQILRQNSSQGSVRPRAGFFISRHDSWGAETQLIFETDGVHLPWYYGTPHRGKIIGQFDR